MWHAVPIAAAAMVIGVPLGIVVGRVAFTNFARSIGVIDTPSSPPWLVAVLILITYVPWLTMFVPELFYPAK